MKSVIQRYETNCLAPLFPRQVRTHEIHFENIAGELYPQEAALIGSARPKRQKEFRVGRLCAREILAGFGITQFPLLSEYRRAPVWPEGICGSITHVEGYCGVAVAAKTVVKGLGVDAVCLGRLDPACWPLICSWEEQRWLSRFSPRTQEKYVALIFSCKESFYKCQYPLTKAWVDFHDVKVTFGLRKNTFQATLGVDVHPDFPKGSCWKGKFLFQNNHVFTGMTLTP